MFERAVPLLAILGACSGISESQRAQDPPGRNPRQAGGPELWWPQFRGPNGRGVASGVKPLPVHFGPSKNVLWKTVVPAGHSSPCIWDDRIFLTGFDPKAHTLETLCLDRAGGDILWRRPAPAGKIEKVHRISNPAVPTPVTDGRHVYVYFGSYGVLCYDFGGNEKWKRPLPLPKLPFGTGSSPILAGELLLVNVDQQGDAYLLALDRRTGRTVWRKTRPSLQRGWTTPVHVRHEGTDQVVVLGGRRLLGRRLSDGAEQWWIGGMPPYPIPTPVVAGDRLFVAVSDEFGDPENVIQPPPFEKFAGEHDKNRDGKIGRDEIPADFLVISRNSLGGAGDVALRGWYFGRVDGDKDGALSREEWDRFVARMADWPTEFKVVLMAVRLDGRGDVTRTHVAWRKSRGVPEAPSPLVYGGRIYTIRNGGIIFCRDGRSGKEVYRGRLGARGGYYASPVAGDGKLYAASDRGVMVVVKAGGRLEVLARNDLAEPIMATPGIVDGKLYVRTDGHLFCFGK